MEESLKFGRVLIKLWVSVSGDVTQPEDQQASNKDGRAELCGEERRETTTVDMAVVRRVIESDEKEKQEE